MLITIILLASCFGAIMQYLDKYLVNSGISKNDYFYYTCLSTIPFSLVMIIIEYITNNLKFELKFITIILLLLAMLFRYKKQSSVVLCLKHLNPYEDAAYLSLGIIIAFIIDVILKVETFKYMSLLSILLTITGVFIISNSKLRIKNLKKDLIIRIISSLIMSYITHYILKYFSIAVFMFLLNLFLTIIFSKNYSFKYHLDNIKLIKLVFIEQIFGFSSLYLSNYLSSKSVTLSTYVKPSTIIVIVIISLFFKDKNKKPTFTQLFGSLLVIIGILFIGK